MKRRTVRAALPFLLAAAGAATMAGCGLPEKVRALVARPTPTPLPAPTPPPAPPLKLDFLGIREERVRGGAGAPSCAVDVELAGTRRSEVEAARVTVRVAVDDLGTSLVPDGPAGLEPIRDGALDAPVVLPVPLKLASRRATSNREVSGEIELYVPSADPAATVTIPRFRAEEGKPLALPALAANGIEIAIQPLPQDDPQALDPDAVVLKVSDPRSRILGFFFVDPAGTAWATNRERRGDLAVVSSQAETPRPDWGLQVRLLTPSTLRRYRFALRDVPLP